MLRSGVCRAVAVTGKGWGSAGRVIALCGAIAASAPGAGCTEALMVAADAPEESASGGPVDQPFDEAPSKIRACTQCYGSPVGQLVDNEWQQQGTELHGTVAPADCRAEERPRTFLLSGMTTAGGAPIHASIDRGRLSGAVKGSKIALTITEWIGARMTAQLDCADGMADLTVTARVSGIIPSPTVPDTYQYRVELWDSGTGEWIPACQSSSARPAVAIPLAGVYDERGSWQRSTTAFTFACMTSAAEKCYERYQPWSTSVIAEPERMQDLHQACTRMMRADYCGDGSPATSNGTLVHFWNSAGIIAYGTKTDSYSFEAAWSPAGAVCMDHPRHSALAHACTDAAGQPRTVPYCGTAEGAEALAPKGADLVFNESDPD
jgi:hypothetical protein